MGENPQTTMASDATNPSITKKKITNSFPGEKLDKLKSNYKKWGSDILLSLTLNGLGGYPTGTVKKPSEPEQPRAHQNWLANDALTTAFIATYVVDREHDFVDLTKTSAENWTILKERHQNEGPVRQVNLLLQALTTRCTKETPLPETAAQICTDIERAFAMDNITSDLLCCIALLNSLGTHFPHARSIVLRDISASTKGAPYTSVDIRRYLENEQTLHESDQTTTATESIALAARTPNNGIPTCIVCKKRGHSVKYCISEGGDMAGKTLDESKEARSKDRLVKRGRGGALKNTPPGGKVNVTMTGTNGQAFSVLVDPKDLAAIQDTPTTKEFVGIASSTPSDLLSDIESLEYNGYMAWIEEEPKTSVDWNKNTCSADVLTATPLQQSKHTPIDLKSHPFFLDTGASISLSPEPTDFVSITPISSRSVSGVGGSSITAIGRGDIKLHIARGASIILRDALYIPNATVRLISIRCLARDSNIVAHFDDTKCWLTNKSTRALVTKGSLLPNKNLYTLDITSAHAEHALSVHAQPTIETWHHRLGHANFQTVSEMVRNGLIKGASASSHKPAKCDSCILGKQTQTSVPKRREEGTGHKATRKLEKVWVDLAGPHPVASRSGYLYTMDLIDDFTDAIWVIPLKSKDQAWDELKAWQLRVENESGVKVGLYNTDSGELKSTKMEEWLKGRGTQQCLTSAYTSAHNGRVERLHRTLMAKA